MSVTRQQPPDELARALEDSKAWVESAGANGKPFYLAYESWPHLDLSGSVLVEAMLQEADLSDSFLDRVDAARSIANGICLTRTSMIESIWVHAEMEGADLTEAKAHGARFTRARLTRACLRGCDLRDATLRHAVCIGADLSEASLVGADVSDVLLAGADLSRADLTGARLDGCRLDTGTRMTGALGLAQTRVSHVFTEDGRLDGDEARRLLLRLQGNRTNGV